jgi:predicted transcriptional regulator
MKTKYRNRTEIIARLLQAATAHNGISITRLIYGTFLSYARIKEHTRLLIQNRLLDYDGLTRTYRTNEKGLKFLELYDKLRELTTTTNTNEIKSILTEESA